MSSTWKKDVEKYVAEKMPKRVKKALADAQFSLHHGPSGGGGMGWLTASKIVEDWWDENMREDLVVDDGGNVSTQYDFDRWLRQEQSDRYKEAVQEAIDQGVDDDEVHDYAEREAANYVEGHVESTTIVDSGDVRTLILGRDWA